MKQIRKSMASWLLTAACLALAEPAVAEIYTLGDSISDAGSLGITYTNPASVSPRVAGRVWIQDLTNSTPAFCNDRKRCAWSPTTFYYGAGNNYAVGGAGVMFDSMETQGPNSFTSLGAQVAALANSGKLKPGDIVTVLMGANDILAAASRPASADATVKAAAAAYVQYVAGLAAHVKKPQIFVLTVPDIGQSPLGKSSVDGGATLSRLTAVFNDIVSTGLQGKAGVRLLDSNGIFVQLARSFVPYPTYCAQVIDLGHACGTTSNPESIPATGELLFADPLHPSRAAHEAIADYLASRLR
ncbi:MAG: hypothetical protein RJA36_744 [Pseudomonadota bacterium]|jgi:outer membrane lipase/esterase